MNVSVKDLWMRQPTQNSPKALSLIATIEGMTAAEIAQKSDPGFAAK